MKRLKIAVAEFKHETNCFCHTKAGRKEYEERLLIESEEILRYFQSTKTEVGGFIEAAKEEILKRHPAGDA